MEHLSKTHVLWDCRRSAVVVAAAVAVAEAGHSTSVVVAVVVADLGYSNGSGVWARQGRSFAVVADRLKLGG